KAMAFDYKRIQFTPDTMASDITGFSIYNKREDTFDYKEGAALCNLFLADEINRTSAKTQAALLEVMEEHGVTVDGITHKTPEPFICIATQNPLGSAGTQKLPDSQLDRFMVKLSMGYPDVASQVNIIKQRQGENPLNQVKKVVSGEEILEMKETISRIHIEDDVIQYAAELCAQTRTLEVVDQGVSPRAVLALVQMAKAHGFIAGRNYVIPEDIQAVFIDVCAHRIILTAKAKIRKETEENILMDVLKKVNPPTILGGK
ncbi:MAG: MoxR family ATPase, partial [Anaerovoracaceae bacterium]